MTFERAEKYRRPHPFGLSHKVGDPFGWFEIPLKITGPKLRCQVSTAYKQFEFEHVSVSLAHRCPTREEMCLVKNLFWDDGDTVVQYHPRKSEYVNHMKYCLHLWRWMNGDFPRPKSIEIGPANG